jgi:hypothetical protein
MILYKLNPAAGVAYRPLACEDRVVSRESRRDLRWCGSGGVQGDRRVGGVRDGRGTVACRTAAGHRVCYGQQNCKLG